MNKIIITLLSFALLFAHANSGTQTFAQNQTSSSNGNNGPISIQNQTKGPLEQLGESIGNLIGAQK